MGKPRVIFGLVLVTSLATATLAKAENAPPNAAPPSPKRTLPDYDGRPPPPTDEDDANAWVLRILLSPLYFVSEYVFRKPSEAMTVWAERAEVPQKLYNFFLFGPQHKLGFVPTALAEFGFNPSIGIYGFWFDAFKIPNNDLRLHISAWPDDWLMGTLTEHIHVRENDLTLRAEGMNRPDRVFYGFGPTSKQQLQSRYREAHFETRATIDTHIWRSSLVEATVGLRKVTTSHGHYGSDPSVEQRVASGQFPTLPYGFNDTYIDPFARLLLRFDTRPMAATRGSGLRLEVQGEHGTDVEHTPTSSWVRWGGTATVYWDLNNHGRILSLSAVALFADPLNNQPIPFTELISLGGDHWMTGYFEGRLVDRSAAVLQLRYAWPIAPWLGGTLHAAVGNVFGEHFEGFKAGLLRFSGAVGLTTVSDPPIEFLFGFGTEPFDLGGNIDSFRLALGVPLSF